MDPTVLAAILSKLGMAATEQGQASPADPEKDGTRKTEIDLRIQGSIATTVTSAPEGKKPVK